MIIPLREVRQPASKLSPFVWGLGAGLAARMIDNEDGPTLGECIELFERLNLPPLQRFQVLNLAMWLMWSEHRKRGSRTWGHRVRLFNYIWCSRA